ncbi:ribose transport system ATP-binding protein [Deinococcus metalli]|uniref:Ribose import ATP-binding protein RbsA 1 n=1 Tax=Deinococcus metalli TaxID=1141878 RepID=A0A7W8KCQ9_9DEIO|nr:sugar ABC transporter ATP-binding protein [Deinococcus metalli]MBB5375792.1 ribose transport system ATP-binding protein [Deinococcus metalli]GHF37011.1 ribose import ATP-binding protein RbsA 1 [Deinococcus metalli]
MAELLSAHNINKSFSGVQVLRDVHFSLGEGEVHALLGENGAGKSTLLKTLFGMHQPDSGTLSVGGQSVVLHSPRAAQDHGIAMIHQELALIPELTVAQNVLLGNEGRERLNYAHMNARVQPFLERVGLKVAPGTPVKRLTIAQQQMVEIARALARQARIIIMDEPTSSLTTQETRQLYAVVRELTAGGVGIIYVSHHFDEIEELADRVTVLRDGQYVGTVEQRGVTREQLVTMMVGRELAAQHAPPHRTPGDIRLKVSRLGRAGAFDDVSFSVRAGEVVTLAGLIGSGRTEVLRAVYGADTAECGEVELDGEVVARPTPAGMMRRGTGFIPEDRRHQGIVPDARVSVNMMLTSWAKGRVGVRGTEMRREVEPQMEQLGIRPNNPQQVIRRLSGGNQQKVILARWLAAGCGLLLIDEPTRGIDVASKADIYALIDSLAERGVAVLMVSSELPEVLRLSDRVLVMREGTVAGELSRQDASEERILALATGAHAHAEDPVHV